jgi:hypothetical protein
MATVRVIFGFQWKYVVESFNCLYGFPADKQPGNLLAELLD